MKKVIYLLGIMLLMAGAAKAQDEKVRMGAEIKFEKVVHDYGDVPFNGNGECEFRFTNTGTEPLLVLKPKSSCGCTIPSCRRVRHHQGDLPHQPSRHHQQDGDRDLQRRQQSHSCASHQGPSARPNHRSPPREDKRFRQWRSCQQLI